MKKNVLFVLLLMLSATVRAGDCCGVQNIWDTCYPPRDAYFKREWIAEWVKDFFRMQGQMFSWDTLKVAAVVTPFYIGTRALDKSCHKLFYCRDCHSNINQAHHTLCEFSRVGLPVEIALLGSLIFFSPNPELRLTSFVYTQGVISVWIVKNIFKNGCKIDGNLRPGNGDFDKHKKVHGGLPSGHTAEACFAALLFGLRHGPLWGIPLGAFAATVFGISINSNRHFASQVVAGAALGIMYGIAAFKVIEAKMPKNLCVNFTANDRCQPCVNFSYRF